MDAILPQVDTSCQVVKRHSDGLETRHNVRRGVCNDCSQRLPTKSDTSEQDRVAHGRDTELAVGDLDSSPAYH